MAISVVRELVPEEKIQDLYNLYLYFRPSTLPHKAESNFDTELGQEAISFFMDKLINVLQDSDIKLIQIEKAQKDIITFILNSDLSFFRDFTFENLNTIETNSLSKIIIYVTIIKLNIGYILCQLESLYKYKILKKEVKERIIKYVNDSFGRLILFKKNLSIDISTRGYIEGAMIYLTNYSSTIGLANKILGYLMSTSSSNNNSISLSNNDLDKIFTYLFRSEEGLDILNQLEIIYRLINDIEDLISNKKIISLNVAVHAYASKNEDSTINEAIEALQDGKIKNEILNQLNFLLLKLIQNFEKAYNKKKDFELLKKILNQYLVHMKEFYIKTFQDTIES